MNFGELLNPTREIVQSAQASYSEKDWREDRVKKPIRFYLIGDRRFDTQLRDQRTLLERGHVVWGAIVQANKILFVPNGPAANLPAAIIYSTNSALDGEPERLIEFAHRLHDLKGTTCTAEMQAFADKLADERVADIKLAIPTGFTDGVLCYYATLLIPRKHLPDGYLANGIFPVLVAPEETDAVMVLPQKYWHALLKVMWMIG